MLKFSLQADKAFNQTVSIKSNRNDKKNEEGAFIQFSGESVCMYGRRQLKELGGLEWTDVRLRGKFGIGNFRAVESEMGSKERGVGEGHRIENCSGFRRTLSLSVEFGL